MLHHIERGNYIEDYQAGNFFRMIERHPIGNSSAAIVACYGEPVKAERLHDFYQCIGHAAFAAVVVIGIGCGSRRVAIAGQVRDYYGMRFGQAGCYFMPGQFCYGKTV